MTPKEQAEALLDAGLPVAEKLLQEDGAFLPFGAVRLADGQVQLVGSPDDAPADAAEVLGVLEQAIAAEARLRLFVAAAVFADVLVTPPDEQAPTDAVRVSIEHQDGYCVEVFVPYRWTDDGIVAFGEIFAEGREGIWFGDGEAGEPS